MTNIQKIEAFLSANFQQSAYCGDIASNNKVVQSKRIYTIRTGSSVNDISGTFCEVMKRLQEIKDRHDTEI